MQNNRNLSVAECAELLSKMSTSEVLIISGKDFGPIATLWAQSNPGKTLWLSASLEYSLSEQGNSYELDEFALEASIRGKLKGDAITITEELNRYFPKSLLRISPKSINALIEGETK